MTTRSVRPKKTPASKTARPLAKKTASRRISAAVDRSTAELGALQGFRTIFGSARVHDAEVRKAAGLPGSQLWALSEIAQFDGMSVNWLSERMALHQSTASNLVNALVERQLVRRVRDAEDQRIVHLHVAAEGKRLLMRAPGPYAGLLVAALRKLEARQLAELRDSLDVLVALLQQTAETAAGEPLLGL